jgi:predicted  nucleic acid-binding Zn-ribbon protein
MAENRDISSFPQDAQDYIRELRSEAAGYRTERNDYRTKYTEVNGKYTEAGQLLQAANTRLDEFSAAQDAAEKSSTEVATLNEQVQRVNTWAEALGVDLSDASRLQGKTVEEWKADAEKLAPRFLAQNGPAGVPKNPAAGSKAKEPTEDPFSKAFSDAGL